jgi:hypothetical protein
LIEWRENSDIKIYEYFILMFGSISENNFALRSLRFTVATLYGRYALRSLRFTVATLYGRYAFGSTFFKGGLTHIFSRPSKRINNENDKDS